jgi:hypothetical protein
MEDILILDDTPLGFSPYEDIAACSMAMDCIQDMDGVLMSREDAERIAEIKSMVLRIVHIGIKEIYDANFYAEEGEDT